VAYCSTHALPHIFFLSFSIGSVIPCFVCIAPLASFFSKAVDSFSCFCF
jgi:hypothetical protein